MSLMTIETPAVVKWNLDSVAASVKDDIASALSIAPYQVNLPALRGARAQLNKDRRQLDDFCSAMRDAYMAAFNRFKEDYDVRITAEYRRADDALKSEINSIEEQMKAERAERILDHIEKVTGTRDESYLPKILLSASEKSLIDAADELIRERNFHAPECEVVCILRGEEHKIEAVKKFAATCGVTIEEVE